MDSNKKLEWVHNKLGGNYVLDNSGGKVVISYQPNDVARNFGLSEGLDSANPETAIVLIDDIEIDGQRHNRYLIFRGDRRAELEALYPDVDKLKEYWRKEGGHFWTDSLDD